MNKILILSLLIAGGFTALSSGAAEAHILVCKCTEIVDFCYWENNH